VKLAELPDAHVARLQVIVPVLPGRSGVQLNPDGAEKETNVVLAGVAIE